MALFDLFKPKAIEPEEQKRIQKRSYAAANTGRLFADFKYSEASSDAELQNAIHILRSRSRELSRNNEYAKRYLNLLKTNVVGERGFTLQVKAVNSVGDLDQTGNQEIEDTFKMWGRKGHCTVDGRLSWVDAQRLVIEGLARDGEVFIIKHRGNGFKDSFAIEFIEPDQIDHKVNNKKLDNGNEVRMGVELDKFRRPVAYYMTKHHPGDTNYTSKSLDAKYTRLPADRVIHIFMPLRAGQTRGEPWMTPAIGGLKHLGAFVEAATVNARMGASKMGFFTSPAGDGFVADDLDNNVPIIEAEPGTFHQLPEGVSFQSFEPQFPNNEFASFHKTVLKGIASALGVSYTALSNDLESVSYSSIRSGSLEERDYYRTVQGFLIDHFVRPVFEAWLSSAMEIGALTLPLATYNKFASAAEFRGRAWAWVDPLKEMNAAINGLKSGILSLQDVATSYGKDTEELLSQIQRDKALMAQFGIDYALEPYNANFGPISPEGYDQNTESDN